MGFGWCASERDRKGDGIRDRKSLESPCVKELISQIVDSLVSSDSSENLRPISV
jgi:hypothetical protein